MSPRTKRRLTALVPALVFAAAVLAAGCASGTPSPTSAGSPSTSVPATATTQPVTSATVPITVPATAPSTTSTAPARRLGTQTMVILGNDTREQTVTGTGNSDVIMLLRVDPEQDFLSVLSVTRDLWVDIPGKGKDRINAAYRLGRAPLAMSTIESVFGLHVDHYIELGFTAFSDIVDSLGGALVDIDRRYDKTPYWSIDIYPGYQVLKGSDALRFARFRFDQNSDFGRMSRQQRILAGIRQQAAQWDLDTKLPGLIQLALGWIGTDLSAADLQDVVTWIVGLGGDRIKQAIIRGQGTMIDGNAVVVVDPSVLRAAAQDFMTPPPAAAPEPSATPPAPGGSTPDLAKWKAAQAATTFPLEAPAYVPAGFALVPAVPPGGAASPGRRYTIPAETGKQPAVRMVYRYKGSDFYLGVTATPWTAAPVAAAGIQVRLDGIVYTVVGTSGKVHHIWWMSDGVLYFLSNTVMWTVPQDELLRMALSMKPVGD